ncbi:TolC family protein [Olivibacter domesticus]|uniref:Outer membrane protein TolC n=1 Tax=Olivibacter domesticus TaxID=407022 RepID=A0A1H7MXL2_OLID1|nr:TolC family protein [Olivibacter domesticus]SEL16062.1 Outer membrane protein TolC [Olivibacter domesticus]
MKTPFIFILLSFLCFPFLLKGQTSILEGYIDEGMQHNLVLKRKNISLDKALLALKTAKSMYQPSVALQASYSTATGGRSISLPLGDLMNPVYATLNQLTNSQNFPMLENESINFLPKNYYDARVRTTVPIINTDIIYNRKINEQQVTLQEFEVQTYERELIKNIKSAYFNFLNAQQAVKIYQSALRLAEESKRVNERLLESGKGLHAYVLRSNSEIEQVRAQVTQAAQQQVNARLYFNSLLNRDGETAIDTAYNADDALNRATVLLQSDPEISGREELKSLQQVIHINENIIKMNKKFSIPKISGFLDLGSQAEQMRFNDQSRYAMVGLQFDLPIYSGNRNRIKVKQSQLELADASLNRAYIEKQLQVSSNVAKNNLLASWQTYQSSLKQLESAAAYQRLIDKGYKAGTNTYIETIDARNQLTSAQLATLVNKYNVLLASAELERETAAYPLKK